MDQKEKERLFTQMATWELAGLPQVEIAKLLSLDESRVSQVMALPQYQEIKLKLAATQAEKDNTYNDLWDLNEERALRVVKTTLEASPRDGEFALRVAAVSNRARRRGSNSGGTLNAQQGMRAAVTLPLSFVRKLEASNGSIKVTEEHYAQDAQPQQNINILKPAEVERLFGNGIKTVENKKKDMLEGLELTF